MLNRYQIIKKRMRHGGRLRDLLRGKRKGYHGEIQSVLQRSGIHAKYSLLHKDVLEISNGRATFKAVKLKKYIIKDDVGMNSPHLSTVFAKNEISALTTYMNTLDAPIGGETGIIGITDVFPDGRPRLIMGYGSQFIAECAEDDKTKGKALEAVLE